MCKICKYNKYSKKDFGGGVISNIWVNKKKCHVFI